MPLYDYECERCGFVFEDIARMDDSALKPCPLCPGLCQRLMSFGRGENVFRDEAPWIRSVLTVVAKDSRKPHTREFLSNPTRSNYEKWLKAEGLRPYDPGERRSARENRMVEERSFESKHAESVMREWQKGKRIEL